MTVSLSAVASPLISVARAIWPHLGHVYQERRAGQMPFSGGHDPLARGIDDTLDRLRRGNVDNTWWQNLLDRIEHPFVAPDFLRMPALREWLADEQVQRDFKALARDRIMGADSDDQEALARLRQAYAAITGEDERLADWPITVVTAILAAGYLGSIAPQLQPLAGMIRAGSQENREQFDAVHRRFDELGPDHYVVAAHSEHAERELNLLLKQRSLEPERMRQELLTLAQRVTDGDLHHVERSIRAKVQYWAARLHATQSETLSVARHRLEQLHQTDPGFDTRISDALILEAEGNVDSALQTLRDIDTPDGRATFFTTLFRRRGAETALSWFDEQPERDNASFLTGLGWSNVAVCLAKTGRWEEAADRLAAAQEYMKEWPVLALVEGVVNVAMLLPLEWRQHALETMPFYETVRPVEGVDADRHRARARACFEKAQDLLVNIGQPGRAQGARDGLLWLRLTDPTPAVARKAQQEIQEGMHDGQRAVNLIPFARAFDIEFDDAPLQRYLIQRKRTGGLNDRELVAEFFLAELRMPPRERAEFLEREEDRLSQVVSKATLAWKRIEKSCLHQTR
jgi:tetratricopeptide (TPR) repeat protein